jgi:hypothetical protein
MVVAADDRIPVVFGTLADAGAGDFVVRADAAVSGFHVAGCACCTPRGALPRALGGLYLARARGEVAWFRRVVVVAADVAGARAALAADRFVTARFQLPAHGEDLIIRPLPL